jgi:hypothetical protein
MVDPGRSSQTDDAVPFQHGVKDAVIKDRRSRRNDGKGDSVIH